MYVTAVVVFGTWTVLNVMEAGDQEQQEFLDRSVFSDALPAMKMDYNAARSAAAQRNWKGSTPGMKTNGLSQNCCRTITDARVK